jgi:hypothetical protein
VAVAGLAAAGRAQAQPAPAAGRPTPPGVLRLQVAGGDCPCFELGNTVTVTLSMSGLTQPITGYQAILGFDPTVLQFVSGSYALPAPFGWPVITPIVADGATLSLAAGINPIFGQQPTLTDADLATLTFHVLAIGTTDVGFAAHAPPTSFSSASGRLLPLLEPTGVLRANVVCPARVGDIDGDDDTDSVDFARLAGALAGPAQPNPPAGATLADFLNSDLDCDHDADLADFGSFQIAYTH